MDKGNSHPIYGRVIFEQDDGDIRTTLYEAHNGGYVYLSTTVISRFVDGWWREIATHTIDLMEPQYECRRHFARHCRICNGG